MARVTERRTLQFTLPYLSADTPVALHVGRRRHALGVHTAETLARHRAANPALALIADDKLTHYAEDVKLRATARSCSSSRRHPRRATRCR